MQRSLRQNIKYQMNIEHFACLVMRITCFFFLQGSLVSAQWTYTSTRGGFEVTKLSDEDSSVIIEMVNYLANKRMIATLSQIVNDSASGPPLTTLYMDDQKKNFHVAFYICAPLQIGHAFHEKIEEPVPYERVQSGGITGKAFFNFTDEDVAIIEDEIYNYAKARGKQIVPYGNEEKSFSSRYHALPIIPNRKLLTRHLWNLSSNQTESVSATFISSIMGAIIVIVSAVMYFFRRRHQSSE